MVLRAKRGSVSINAKAGKLRIVLPRNIGDGKQNFIYTGFDDTPQNRRKAQMVALQIESDVEAERLDGSLEKYRIALGIFKNQQRLQIIPKAPNLKQLWAKYCEFKEHQISPTSYIQDFLGRYARAIEKLPTKEIRVKKEYDIDLVPNLSQGGELLTVKWARKYAEGFEEFGRSGWHTCKCPAHSGNSDDSLHINAVTGALKCHSGCESRDVVVCLRQIAKDAGDPSWNVSLYSSSSNAPVVAIANESDEERQAREVKEDEERAAARKVMALANRKKIAGLNFVGEGSLIEAASKFEKEIGDQLFDTNKCPWHDHRNGVRPWVQKFGDSYLYHCPICTKKKGIGAVKYQYFLENGLDAEFKGVVWSEFVEELIGYVESDEAKAARKALYERERREKAVYRFTRKPDVVVEKGYLPSIARCELPKGNIALKGDWGVGKTHFISNFALFPSVSGKIGEEDLPWIKLGNAYTARTNASRANPSQTLCDVLEGAGFELEIEQSDEADVAIETVEGDEHQAIKKENKEKEDLAIASDELLSEAALNEKLTKG